MFKQAVFTFILLFTTIFSTTVFADQLIIEPEAGRTPLLQAMNATQHSLQLVMYGFTDQTLLQAILNQKRKNKLVQIILERKPYRSEDENLRTIAAFKKYHIDWRGKVSPFRLIHQKTLLIDHQKAIVMTFNFTSSAFKNQRNFALIIDNPTVINEIAAVFAADFNQQTITPREPTLVFSPNNSREKILALIQNARHSIDIYAQSLNDFKLVGALAKAARRGVTVRIITSQKLHEKQQRFLAKNKVAVNQSKLYIHAKVMIIDKQKALLGSINFTSASLDNNRELSVITSDKKVVQQLENTFAKDWQGENHFFHRNPLPNLKLYSPTQLLKRLLHHIDKTVHHYF